MNKKLRGFFALITLFTLIITTSSFAETAFTSNDLKIILKKAKLNTKILKLKESIEKEEKKLAENFAEIALIEEYYDKTYHARFFENEGVAISTVLVINEGIIISASVLIAKLLTKKRVFITTLGLAIVGNVVGVILSNKFETLLLLEYFSDQSDKVGAIARRSDVGNMAVLDSLNSENATIGEKLSELTKEMGQKENLISLQ